MELSDRRTDMSTEKHDGKTQAQNPVRSSEFSCSATATYSTSVKSEYAQQREYESWQWNEQGQPEQKPPTAAG
jgi:hypothetical protein